MKTIMAIVYLSIPAAIILGMLYNLVIFLNLISLGLLEKIGIELVETIVFGFNLIIDMFKVFS